MKRMTQILVAGLVALGMTGPAAAGDNAVMVELYTSQGCSSCPPADAALGELAARDDVLALSLHVDYWNYLGWQDTFSQRQFTERQYAYRELMNARVVYTPQVIVDGHYDVVGSRTGELRAALQQALNNRRTAGVRIVDDGGMLKAEISPMGSDGPCTIYIASYQREATVRIKRGENAGRTITYHNVVDKLMRVGTWQGATAQTVSLPQPAPGEGVAIWIQDDRTGRIHTASFVNR